MKIILALSDSSGKTRAYVTDDLQIRTVEETVSLARSGSIPHASVVTRGSTQFVKILKQSGLPSIDSITATQKQLLVLNSDSLLKAPQLQSYWDVQKLSFPKAVARGEIVQALDTPYYANKEHVRSKILSHKISIFEAAAHFNLDPYLIGAILIDEIVRIDALEDIAEFILVKSVSYNASVGDGQVKLDVAKDLIVSGYYNPLSENPNFSRERSKKLSRKMLFPVVQKERNNIFFVAAQMKRILDTWRTAGIEIDASIIATLYSIGLGNPHPNPQSNERGRQIVDEFYELSRQILL